MTVRAPVERLAGPGERIRVTDRRLDDAALDGAGDDLERHRVRIQHDVEEADVDVVVVSEPLDDRLGRPFGERDDDAPGADDLDRPLEDVPADGVEDEVDLVEESSNRSSR